MTNPTPEQPDHTGVTGEFKVIDAAALAAQEAGDTTKVQGIRQKLQAAVDSIDQRSQSSVGPAATSKTTPESEAAHAKQVEDAIEDFGLHSRGRASYAEHGVDPKSPQDAEIVKNYILRKMDEATISVLHNYFTYLNDFDHSIGGSINYLQHATFAGEEIGINLRRKLIERLLKELSETDIDMNRNGDYRRLWSIVTGDYEQTSIGFLRPKHNMRKKLEETLAKLPKT